MSPADLNIILPEIVLAVFAMLTLLGAVYTGKDKLASAMVWATAALFLVLALWIGTTGSVDRIGFGGLFIDDSFSRFAKIVILVSAAAVLLMGEGFMSRHNLLRFEYPVLVTCPWSA